MGKKKKKDLNPSSSLTPQKGDTPTVVEDPDGDAETLPAVVDAMRLRLDDPSNGKSSKLQPPGALLSQDDARKLDVLPNEEVLVLAWPSDPVVVSSARSTLPLLGGIEGAAICKVLRMESDAPSKAAEPSPGKRRSAVSKGTIRIVPSTVAETLRCCQRDVGAGSTAGGETNDPPTHVSPDASPATAAASSPYSFKVGGGGDRLYSTPSPRTTSPPFRTPPPPKPSKAVQHRDVWVVPTASELGQRVKKAICQSAKALTLELLDDAPSFDVDKVDRILKRVAMAQLVGRYVQVNETLHVSFQGRTMNFRVTNVQPEDESAESLLERSFHQLSLQSKSDDATDLDSTTSNCAVRLFEIGYSTAIDIASGHRDVSSHPGNESDRRKEKCVAGVDSILEQIRSFLLAPLSRSELFQERKLKPPRGLLLHGPSGVGKSSIAKQVAMELEKDGRFTVQFVNCISLQSQTTIVGEAERALSNLFRPSMATHDPSKQVPPVLLVLDDIHLICPKRGGYSTGTDRLTATLLALMDGLDSSENIFTLAITSQPSVLDPALRRPGRLDMEIEVPLPDDAPTRAEILQFHVDNLSATLDATQEAWLELAKLAKGFNGADCMLAVKEALRHAILERYPKAGGDEAHSETTAPLLLTMADLRAGIRLTKPSAIKSITVEIPQVLWSSIGGMDSVKEELKEAIELPLTHSAVLEQLRVPPPKGILLYGPPGCSKTLMARALATQGHMNFLAVKGPELLSKWLGESERALASLFRRARMASPSIVFFDEIDAIACKRGMGNESATNRLLSQLLTELDGVNHLGSAGLAAAAAAGGKALPRVVVIGATNRPDLLDPALTRPGRIDRKIYVGVPDRASRAQIFRLSLQGRSCSDDVDVDELSHDDVSGGYSGAEIVAICRDAALLVLEETDDHHLGSVCIGQRHLLKSISNMQRQITPEMLDFYNMYRMANK